jgi:hypothetical protein
VEAYERRSFWGETVQIRNRAEIGREKRIPRGGSYSELDSSGLMQAQGFPCGQSGSTPFPGGDGVGALSSNLIEVSGCQRAGISEILQKLSGPADWLMSAWKFVLL